MSWRKIVVDGEQYNWKCGHSGVSIRNVRTGKGVNVAITELKPMSQEDLEAMHWHDGIEGVTPGDVRAYIDGNLRREELGLDTIKILRDVFYEKGPRPPNYNGLTLAVETSDGKNLCFTLGKGTTEEEDCWIALNYIKYQKPKNWTDPRWTQAFHILHMTPTIFKKTATKALLKGCC
jgi:hypothetical protein